MKKTLQLNLLVGSFVVVLMVLYFSIYLWLLQLAISPINILYVIVVAMSYFLLLQVWRSYVWQGVIHLLLGVVFIWALMNYAYFSVFNVFLDFSFGHTAQLKMSVFEMMKEFFFLIPGVLYSMTAVIWLMIVGSCLLLLNVLRKDNHVLQFNSAILKVSQPAERRKVSAIVILMGLFIFLNVNVFALTSYFINNPAESWWDTREQAADLGVFGSLYSQAYAQVAVEDVSVSDLPPLQQSKELLNILTQLNETTRSALPLPVVPEKPNVLVVQLESVGQWAIDNDPSPMPFLKKLMRENVTVKSFHSNSCETIHAEFATLCSFFPPANEPITYSFSHNRYYCLPEILKDDYGYSTYQFHANVSEFWDRNVLSPAWGFENMYFYPTFNQKQPDTSVFPEAVRILSQESAPFFAYLISFTSHAPHNQEQIDFQRDNNDLVITPYTHAINPEYQSVEISEEQVKMYYGFLTAVDDALKIMFDELAAHDLLKNTIVVIQNDHRFYNFESGTIEDFEHYNELPMVIVTPDKQRGVIQSKASQVDLAPTILQMIEQKNYHPREQFVGTSLYDYAFPNHVLNKCLSQVYYLNDKLTIQGSTKSDVYHVFDSQSNLTTIEQQTWEQYVSDLVSITDAVLETDGLDPR